MVPRLEKYVEILLHYKVRILFESPFMTEEELHDREYLVLSTLWKDLI